MINHIPAQDFWHLSKSQASAQMLIYRGSSHSIPVSPDQCSNSSLPPFFVCLLETSGSPAQTFLKLGAGAGSSNSLNFSKWLQDWVKSSLGRCPSRCIWLPISKTWPYPVDATPGCTWMGITLGSSKQPNAWLPLSAILIFFAVRCSLGIWIVEGAPQVMSMCSKFGEPLS